MEGIGMRRGNKNHQTTESKTNVRIVWRFLSRLGGLQRLRLSSGILLSRSSIQHKPPLPPDFGNPGYTAVSTDT